MAFAYPVSEVQLSSSQHVTPNSWALISGYEASMNIGEGVVISAFFQQQPVLFQVFTVRPPLEQMGGGGVGGEVEGKGGERERERDACHAYKNTRDPENI